MLTDKVRHIFEKLGLRKEGGTKSRRRNNRRKSNKGQELPDNVLSKIFDYSSPFDIAKWRTVSQQFNRVAENRDKNHLYMDVLRIDITDIIPEGIQSDGDFFKHPKHNILIHADKRSILLAAHSHWSPQDAEKMLKAVKYFGRYARTISLDASVAELIVAAQSTSDIQHWFQFQTACGSSDSAPTFKGEMPICRSALPRKFLNTQPELPKWNPKTQRIPSGPFFPCAVEIAFRASLPQLRRLRRLSVYRLAPTCIYNPDNIQLIRLTITGGKKCPPTALKLRAFLDWINVESLSEKYCVQFC